MAHLIEKPAIVARDHYLLRIDIEGACSLPGQFLNVRVGTGTDPLIRRPFSIFFQDGRIQELVVRVVGKGTRLLCESQPGPFDVITPLGRGFTLMEKGRALLVGGGVGSAPLYYLARRLKEAGCRVVMVYGARSREYVFLEERFREALDELVITTDDGTQGEKGFVTDTAARLMGREAFDRIYTCGPTVMMARLMETVGKEGLPVEVSLENYFGCGIGLCSGCTVETIKGLRRACVDGPVMDGRLIVWNSIDGGSAEGAFR